MQRGSPGYPERLALRLGAEAPGVIWISGDPARIERPQVAFVGSREAPAVLLAAAHRLAAALAGRGWVVAAGCARGADSAALQGGLSGAAGALGFPACGLSTLRGAFAPGAAARLTLAAIAPPLHGFNAGYALRRNALVAGMADALVLVAAGPKSGSWYAVRRALALGTPVFCLECGALTPVGNAWLLRQGKALPLSALEAAERGAEILGVAARDRARTPAVGPRQPDLFETLIGRAA